MVYLYPYREDNKSDKLIDLDSIKLDSEQQLLIEYIIKSGKVKDLVGYNDELLHIYSRKVLTMIRNDEKGWEEFVPEEITKTINENVYLVIPASILLNSLLFFYKSFCLE